MKRSIKLFLTLASVLLLAGCTQNKEQASVVNTYEEGQESVYTTYYELSDGTWKTDEYTYRYRLELTGRLNGAEKDTTYVILSNSDDITFEQAWKASGLSSDTSDYFDIEDAKIVEIQ